MPRFFKKIKTPSLLRAESRSTLTSEKPVVQTEEPKTKESFKTLVAWRAPSRIFRQRDRGWYTTVGVIMAVLILIATLAQEFLAIGLVLAIAFLYFVLGSTEPEEVEHKITTEGVTTGNFSYIWEELSGFWFDKKQGFEILVLETKKRFPPSLVLLLNRADKELIRQVLSGHLTFFEKPKTSALERLGNFLGQKFPVQISR